MEEGVAYMMMGDGKKYWGYSITTMSLKERW